METSVTYGTNTSKLGRTILLLLFFHAVILVGQQRKEVAVDQSFELMGTNFKITVIAPNQEIGYIYINEAVAEIKRVEELISSWNPKSQTSLINKNAGIKPVPVDFELFSLIERAKHISEITDGAFDISYAAMDAIWQFNGTMQYMPTANEIHDMLAKVDYKKIILDGNQQTVFLQEKGMKIAFGAIGKGFAIDKAKALLQSKQVSAGAINANGDVSTWGSKINGDKWYIGIPKSVNTAKISHWMPIVESSAATTNDSGKHVMFEGKKYMHVLDPRSGQPASGIKSVSVFAKSAEYCDALATAIFVLGRDRGIALINLIGAAEVLILDTDNKLYKSNGIPVNINE